MLPPRPVLLPPPPRVGADLRRPSLALLFVPPVTMRRRQPCVASSSPFPVPRPSFPSFLRRPSPLLLRTIAAAHSFPLESPSRCVVCPPYPFTPPSHPHPLVVASVARDCRFFRTPTACSTNTIDGHYTHTHTARNAARHTTTRSRTRPLPNTATITTPHTHTRSARQLTRRRGRPGRGGRR